MVIPITQFASTMKDHRYDLENKPLFFCLDGKQAPVSGSWIEMYEWDVFRLFSLEYIVWSYNGSITVIATADETFLFALTADRNLQIEVVCVQLRAFQGSPGLISISRSMTQRRRSITLLTDCPPLFDYNESHTF